MVPFLGCGSSGVSDRGTGSSDRSVNGPENMGADCSCWICEKSLMQTLATDPRGYPTYPNWKQPETNSNTELPHSNQRGPHVPYEARPFLPFFTRDVDLAAVPWDCVGRQYPGIPLRASVRASYYASHCASLENGAPAERLRTLIYTSVHSSVLR